MADAGEGGPVVVVGLDVHADQVGAGFGEGLDVPVRLGEHQVGVEEQPATGAPQRRQRLGSERQVRDEVSVHQIEVKPVESGLGDARRAGREIRVVSGEQRGCEDRRKGVHRGILYHESSAASATRCASASASSGRVWYSDCS